jgi:ADP-dependent NAD(P)H-hydrate dehydratase
MKDVSDEPLPKLEPRDRHGHKGSYGRLLLVGGSRGMAGSISLSGMAALRSGAGLVTIATPRCVQATVAGFSPAYMTVGLVDNDDTFTAAAIDPLLEWCQKMDVVGIGPGLGRTPDVTALVKRMYAEVSTLMVVDADGLNALAEAPAALASPGGPRVLTPHPGEFARLTGESVGMRPSTRSKAAIHLALRDTSRQTVVLLKGAGSVVAGAKRYSVNTTGNPGMATGGTGDVLTGIVAALAAQGLDAWQAARLAAHVHGLAGDLAADEVGHVSLVATDLLDHLPRAFRQL